MPRGQGVTALDFEGKRLSHRVAEDRGDMILICTDAEFAPAEQEQREPISVGFRRHHVADDD